MCVRKIKAKWISLWTMQTTLPICIAAQVNGFLMRSVRLREKLTRLTKKRSGFPWDSSYICSTLILNKYSSYLLVLVCTNVPIRHKYPGSLWNNVFCRHTPFVFSFIIIWITTYIRCILLRWSKVKAKILSICTCRSVMFFVQSYFKINWTVNLWLYFDVSHIVWYLNMPLNCLQRCFIYLYRIL